MDRQTSIIIISAVLLLSAATAGFAGGINGALEGADKEMQAVEKKFEDSEFDKKEQEYEKGLITVEGEEPVNESTEDNDQLPISKSQLNPKSQ